MWLCVVSYFQALRELEKLGLNKDMENVVPFENEDHYNDGYASDDDEYGTKKDDLDDDSAERTDSLEYKPEERMTSAKSVRSVSSAVERPKTAVSVKSVEDVKDDFEPNVPIE